MEWDGTLCNFPFVNKKVYIQGQGYLNRSFQGLGRGTVWLQGKESGEERDGIACSVPFHFVPGFSNHRIFTVLLLPALQVCFWDASCISLCTSIYNSVSPYIAQVRSRRRTHKQWVGIVMHATVHVQGVIESLLQHALSYQGRMFFCMSRHASMTAFDTEDAWSTFCVFALGFFACHVMPV